MTLTDKTAYDALVAFVKTHTGKYYTYAIATEIDGVVKVHERIGLPCWGELRPYKADPKYARPDQDEGPECPDVVKKPGDLHYPFPDGTPVGAAMVFMVDNPFIPWLLSSTMSPFRDLVGKTELITDKGKSLGMVVTNTHVNSDILLNFLFVATQAPSRLRSAKETYSDTSMLAEFILASTAMYGYGLTAPSKWMDSAPFSLKRYATGTPSVPPNWEFYLRKPYRRPVIEKIWQAKDDTGAFGTNKSLAAILDVSGNKPGPLDKHIPKLEQEIIACQAA